jgi:hypothetical protein
MTKEVKDFLSTLDPEQEANAHLVFDGAIKRGLPPRLALALAYQESRLKHLDGDKVKIGADGEVGLMQIKIPTAKLRGYKPEQLNTVQGNIDAGLDYLQSGYERYQKDPFVAAAGYNTGYDHPYFANPKDNDLPGSTWNYLRDIKKNNGFQGGPDETTGTTGQADQQKTAVTAPSQEDFVAKMIESIGPAWESMSDDDKLKVLGTVGGAAIGTRQMMTPEKNPPPMSRSPGEKWGAKTGYGLGEGSVREAKERFDKYAPQPLGTQMKAKSLGAGPASLKVVPGTTGALSGNPVVPQPPGPTMGERVSQGVRATGNLMRAAPPITGALGGLGVTSQGEEAGRRFTSGDYTGGAVAGLGAIGSAAMMSRNPRANVIGGALSMASPAVLMVLDKMRQERATPPAPPTQQELEAASRPYFGTPRP